MDVLNPNNPLEGKMDKIIEYFVKVYGEEYRPLISERINNAEFLFFDKELQDRISMIEIKYQKEISKILDEFKQEAQSLLPFSVSNENNQNFSIEQLENLEEWSTQIYDDELYNIANFFRVLINNPKSSKNYTQQEEAFTEALNDPQKYQLITDLLLKFNEIYQQKYKTRLENLLEEKNSLIEMPQKHKNRVEALEQNFYDGLDDFFVRYFNTAFKTNKSKEEMSPILNDSPILIDFLLKKPNFYTVYDRKEYFSLFKKIEKVFALKKHKNIGEFFSDENFMKILGSYELKKEIKTEKHILDDKKSMILSEYFENFGKLLHFDMYFRDELVEAVKNFRKSSDASGFIFTSFFPNEDAFKSICVLNSYFGLSTSTAVHELNHIIENSTRIENGAFVNKCGFDRVTTDIKGLTPQNYTQRFKTTEVKYRYTNEIFNDFLAMRVLDAMKKDNFILGDAEDIPSRYSIVFPYVQDFIQDNMQEIVKVRFDKDFDKVVEKFGEKNLDLLEDGINQILHIDRNTELKDNFSLALKLAEAEIDGLGIKLNDSEMLKTIDTKKLLPVTRNYVEAIKKITTAIENIAKFIKENDTNHENDI